MKDSDRIHYLAHRIVHILADMEDDRKVYEKAGIIHRTERDVNAQKLVLAEEELKELVKEQEEKGGN